MVSSSDPLLVVSLHCPRFPFSAVLSVWRGLIIDPVVTMDPFLLGDNPFKTVKRLVDYVQDRQLSARASPSEIHPGGKF